MYKLFKFIHFIGLTLFLGSIWIYIAEGTSLETTVITNYVRKTMVDSIQHLTFPGLFMMIISGLGMVALRRALFKSTFFKIKLLISILLIINSNHILSIAKQAMIAALALPDSILLLKSYIFQESIYGAINVTLILFLIGYSLIANKSMKALKITNEKEINYVKSNSNRSL